MTNPYYNHTDGVPVYLARGTSSTIEAEYDLIGVGFDGVNTAIVAAAATSVASLALKGNITTQTWLGTHTFPATTYGVTAAFGSSGTAYATLDFVNAVATSAVLPGQGGNSGKFLTTNGTTASWAFAIPTMTVSNRTSNTILAAADLHTIINITSGTFTQTFTAAATLGNGWQCCIKNNGSGDITVDPNGAELIDGLTSYIMYPGEMRLVTCDGAAFTTFIVHPFYRVWTTTAASNFTKPPGYSAFSGYSWSAGASGQRTNNVAVASIGGCGGGCFPFTIPASSFAATETFTIGAGGVAVTTVANGNAGGNTSVGSIFTVNGAGFTNGGCIATSAGSVVSGNNSGIGFEAPASGASPGKTVFGGAATNTTPNSAGGTSIYGGAPGGSIDSAAVVFGPGTSQFAGAGGAAVSASNGNAGTAPGGGGGATQTGTSSGAGARGEIRMWGQV